MNFFSGKKNFADRKLAATGKRLATRVPITDRNSLFTVPVTLRTVR